MQPASATRALAVWISPIPLEVNIVTQRVWRPWARLNSGTLTLAALGLGISALAGGCSTTQVEASTGYAASCLNSHTFPAYGEVRATDDGGFEVFGDIGHRYQAIEITQTAAAARPGTAGQPADDYPKPAMRDFTCKPL